MCVCVFVCVITGDILQKVARRRRPKEKETRGSSGRRRQIGRDSNWANRGQLIQQHDLDESYPPPRTDRIKWDKSQWVQEEEEATGGRKGTTPLDGGLASSLHEIVLGSSSGKLEAMMRAI